MSESFICPHCHQSSSLPGSRPEAERACRNIGGTLVAPACQEEARVLENYLREIVGPGKDCWLGRYDQPDSGVNPGARSQSLFASEH